MPYANAIDKQEYQRRWIAARRAAWFEGKVCADCGTAYDLELDHRDPEQKISHRLWSWSAERRAAELAKCDVRCRYCHRERHAERGEQVPYKCPSQLRAA